jgi:penicillin-binding protein 1B
LPRPPQPAPSFRTRVAPWLRRALPYALALAGIAIGFLGPYVWVLDQRVQAEFGRLQWQVPTRVFARPLELQRGQPLDAATLEAELLAARYVDDGRGERPGTYDRDADRFVLSTRGYRDADGAVAPQRAHMSLKNGRIASLADGEKALDVLRVDPARIATLYGSKQEERRLVRLQDVPPLLITTLQAVEDRDFKHHSGVDWKGIARAASAGAARRARSSTRW